jgi:hypothetical protein
MLLSAGAGTLEEVSARMVMLLLAGALVAGAVVRLMHASLQSPQPTSVPSIVLDEGPVEEPQGGEFRNGGEVPGPRGSSSGGAPDGDGGAQPAALPSPAPAGKSEEDDEPNDDDDSADGDSEDSDGGDD